MSTKKTNMALKNCQIYFIAQIIKNMQIKNCNITIVPRKSKFCKDNNCMFK